MTHTLQRRAIRIIDDPNLTDGLEPLERRRDFGSLFVLYRLFHGECSEELFDMVPSSLFYHRTTRHHSRVHPYHLETISSSTKVNLPSKTEEPFMTRCDYDAVFYRVFCITLLAIAFTFTIILTNVFIDIDGLLSKQGNHKPHIITDNDIIPEDSTPKPISTEDFNYEDNDDSYRTKRSIESQNFLFHIKNPKIKNILTNRLATLLEALDAEESTRRERQDRAKSEPKEEQRDRNVLGIVDDNKDSEEKIKRQKDEDMLHLTMHNILLQGIIGHMDLNDVYKRVNSLMQNLNNAREEVKAIARKSDERTGLMKTQSEEIKMAAKQSIEDKFVAELVRCNELQNNIINSASNNDGGKTGFDMQSSNIVNPRIVLRSDPEKVLRSLPMRMPQRAAAPDMAMNTKIGSNVFIKTIIDIKSIGNDRNDTISKDNIRGMIELTYNGKSLKFTRPDVEMKPGMPRKATLNLAQPQYVKLNKEQADATTQGTIININDLKQIPKDYLNRFVAEYFKHFPKEGKEIITETDQKIETKRLKRHIKIKNEEDSSQQEKPNTKKKTEDDELYVEIETHFDSKGMKGEKKKKLIRTLIEKIQKAIHSSDEAKKQDKGVIKRKKHKQLHVRKRLQNPLEYSGQFFINKNKIPTSNFIHRQLNPIPKIVQEQEGVPNIRDKSGEAWKREFTGPAFLTGTKSINSAEMNELDIDYNKVLNINGVPQRLQKPLNTDMSDEVLPSAFYDLGNMKFLIKDIDGSGFSIGFNQYVDEAPDLETIKLFTGLENVIRTYHQKYDSTPDQTTNVNWNNDEKDAEASLNSQNKNDHVIVPRSIHKKHDHTNEYKIIYDGEFLPFKNYQDIYERKSSKRNLRFKSPKSQFEELPLIVDEHIFDKNLKPSEIFGLANLLQRKKRSLNIKKISHLKRKVKRRYLNTRAMPTKRIYLNKKRNKRQINKIRIIASDMPHKHSSDENVFVVSDENVFADRAIVKEVETAEMEPEKPEETEYGGYQADDTDIPTYRIFEGKSRHNPLMSKYPHIFMEEISRSREDFTPDNALLFAKIPAFNKLASQAMDLEKHQDKNTPEATTTQQPTPDVKKTEPTESIQGVQDIMSALQSPKTNYKVTVKIMPKNMSSGLNSGFKEIHTSINKRFNKNGLLYSSLVNVSEISKVIKLNKTKEPLDYTKAVADAYMSKKIKDQQEKMQLLLKQHQKYINDQLNRLNEEKMDIQSILVDDNNTIIPHLDYLDTLTPSKQQKVLHLSKDDVNKLAAEYLRNKDMVTTVPPSTTLTTTQKPVPSVITTTLATHAPVFNENLKKNILTTIERNENLTDQILKKIDKNTEILQTFLKKLTDKMDTRKQEQEHKSQPTTQSQPQQPAKEEEKTEKSITKFFNDAANGFPLDWRNHPALPFSPNMVIRKNDSHISIPFLYAYQQPMMPHKGNSPVASVVYHGHIHTNTIHTKDTTSVEKDKVQPIHKMVEPNNQTRFFIDELESDYKVIPVSNIKKLKLNKNSTMA